MIQTKIQSRYICGDLIGTGGFGKVYKCVDTLNQGHSLAMKVLSKYRPNEKQEKTLMKLEKEVKLLKQMRECAYVVQYIDDFEEEDCVKLIMEYCGGDLQSHVLKNGPLSESDLAKVAYQILQMLSKCHEQNIVYADVKPANFCLTTMDTVKAIDFGCSRYEEGRTFVGTPAFMAPEIFKRKFSYKADVWSLGISLFWLYTLNFPYTASMSIDDLRDNINSPFSNMNYLNKMISPLGYDFIDMCLAKDEANRPSAQEALVHPWLASFCSQEKK